MSLLLDYSRILPNSRQEKCHCTSAADISYYKKTIFDIISLRCTLMCGSNWWAKILTFSENVPFRDWLGCVRKQRLWVILALRLFTIWMYLEELDIKKEYKQQWQNLRKEAYPTLIFITPRNWIYISFSCNLWSTLFSVKR